MLKKIKLFLLLSIAFCICSVVNAELPIPIYVASTPMSSIVSVGEGVPAETPKGRFGTAGAYYYCKGIDKIPTTSAEWDISSIRTKGEECPVPCPVQPLTPITDPDAIRFENGDQLRKDKLSVAMTNKMQCLSDAISKAGGSFYVNSAWRPTGYQAHLYDINEKRKQLQKPDIKKILACIPILEQIIAERNKHQLKNKVAEPSKSRHEIGSAFDANWSGITDAKVDALAASCGLSRPIADDRPHFQ